MQVGTRGGRRVSSRVVGGAVLLGVAMAASLLVPGEDAGADLLPFGFTQELVEGTGTDPVGLEVLPDGRVLVLQHDGGNGLVQVVEDGVALPTPMLVLPTYRADGGMQGIQDVAVHPEGTHLYVTYTAASPAPHNRLSRWALTGNAVSGPEEVLFELPAFPAGTSTHFGGALAFGPDGNLFWTVGDHQESTNSQRLDNLFGKVLRLHPDGSIPADNPFVATVGGDLRAIYATGVRNPWKMAVDPVTGAMHVNDVGAANWEEVNLLRAGADYGWPVIEGPSTDPGVDSPVYAFHHSAGTPFGCAITGGDFYRPSTATFPADYVGDYLFGDFCNNWIYRLDLATGSLTEFSDETGVAPLGQCGACGQLLDMRTGPDGSLWLLRRIDQGGRDTTLLWRVTYVGDGAPRIAAQPHAQTTVVGAPVTFSVVASGAEPLEYQWQKDGEDIPGATSPSFEIPSVQLTDGGSLFRVVVTNPLGSAISDEVALTVLDGAAPQVTITSPVAGTSYRGGQTIAFSATAIDEEDGALPPSAFEWSVVFHHDGHTHPYITSLPGVTGGTFTVPTTGETETGVFYRVRVRVTDSGGVVSQAFVDVVPSLATITLQTDPPGLAVALDGRPATSPIVDQAVVGVERIIGAPLQQQVGGETWVFSGWSDNGGAEHTVLGPVADRTYTARYQPAVFPPTDSVTIGFVRFDGVAGGNVRTPLPPLPANPSTIEVVANVALDDWTPAATNGILGSNAGALSLSVLKNGRLSLLARLPDGTLSAKSSVRVPAPDGARLWVRAVLHPASGTVDFFVSPSGASDAAAVTDWVRLGSPIGPLATGVPSGLRTIVAGSQNTLRKAPMTGDLYGAAFLWGGATVAAVDFTDADEMTSTPPDETGWGEWTLFGATWETRDDTPPRQGAIWFTGMPGDVIVAPVGTLLPASMSTLDVRANVALHDWTPGAVQNLFGSNKSIIRLEVLPSGRLRFRVKTVDGAEARADSAVAPTIPLDGRLWIRAVYDAAGTIGFFTSTDPNPTATSVAGWVPLGTTIPTLASGAVLAELDRIALGAGNTVGSSGGFNAMVGRLHGGALIVNGDAIATVDVTDLDQLTTLPPDYSGWGRWVVFGSLWSYLPEVA